jgi:hypothetical protein
VDDGKVSGSHSSNGIRDGRHNCRFHSGISGHHSRVNSRLCVGRSSIAGGESSRGCRAEAPLWILSNSTCKPEGIPPGWEITFPSSVTHTIVVHCFRSDRPFAIIDVVDWICHVTTALPYASAARWWSIVISWVMPESDVSKKCKWNWNTFCTGSSCFFVFFSFLFSNFQYSILELELS